jgi:hypothetical protein
MKVFTPIGTKISIKLWRTRRMDIHITMAPKDLYNIEGLCGQFDNNQANDFRHRDGTVSEKNIINKRNDYADFAESWRLVSMTGISDPSETLRTAKLHEI